MSKEGDKASVFRTTKVRNKLKGDASWLQRQNQPQEETEEVKPWIAEVKASRLNGAPIETSPVSSPTASTPPLPTKSETERAPTGFMIRGIFTKLDKPAPTSTSNSITGTTPITKKPSENYKKIAPYTVRSPVQQQEVQLSTEEQEKRTEAASNVLKKAGRQRSYVLSAAKKFETKAPDTSVDNNSLSFVAKRVEISDDDESAATPTPPASSPPPPPSVPVTSVASPPPEPKPRRIVETSVKTAVDVAVNEPVAPEVKVEEAPAAPEPVKEDPPDVSVTEKDPFEAMKPGCTKVDTPLPELIQEYVKAVRAEAEPEDSDAALVDLTPAPQTPTSPTPASPPPASAVPLSPVLLSPVLLSPVPLSPVPLSPAPVSAVTEITVKTEPTPEPEPEQEPEPEPEPVPVPEPKLSPKPSSSVDTLSALSDTLISFDTSSTSFKDDEPALAEEEEEEEEEGCSADTTEDGDEKEPALSNCVPMTDDLLALADGSEEPAEPVPPSPGRWSQDLLGGLDSESSPAKTSNSLDLLANDVIAINTEARSLSTQQEEEKPTDETAKETQSSSTETVTITTKTVIITDKSEEDNADPWSSHVTTTTVPESSSADPFDPYPIGTTSPNSSSDLLQPLSDISINSASAPYVSMENKDPTPDTTMSSNALESLADDVIPINTDTTSPSSHRSWARSLETSTPQRTNTEESREGGQVEDQKTLVMFERKSSENDSPWDRWTSPTVYTVANTREEEEEEEESPEDTQTQTVTTITTIRETHSEPEPVMDRYETYSRRTVTEEEQRAESPEPETKKGFVYVKEYVNATELSLHNARDTNDGGSDYLTSSSANYSYSSPSSYTSGSLSSTCNYCGELVGNDARISIEHLNINCHPACFKCGVCSRPMGDLLFSMFLHGGVVHCESCYRALD